MIDIEKCSLRAFEQDFFAPLPWRDADKPLCSSQTAADFRRQRDMFRFTSSKTDRLRSERLQDAVVLAILAWSFFENRIGCIRSDTRKPVRAALSP